MRHIFGVLFAMFVASLATSPAHSTPVVGITNWNVSGDLAGWTNAAPFGTGISNLLNVAEGGAHSNFLRMSFPANPLSTTNDVMYSSLDAYTGNYANLALRFDYRSVNYLTANTLRLRAADNDIWDLVFDNSAENVWDTFNVAFLYSEGWQRKLAGQTEADFLADLGSITAVGIYVQNSLGAAATQYYDLDNWEYWEQGNPVPEPGTVCMLGGLLLSFGLTQRKRLRELYRQRA